MSRVFGILFLLALLITSTVIYWPLLMRDWKSLRAYWGL